MEKEREVKGWLNCCGTKFHAAKFMNMVFNEPTIHSIVVNKDKNDNVESLNVYATVWDYSDIDAKAGCYKMQEVLLPTALNYDEMAFCKAWFKFVSMLNGERKIDGLTYYEYIKEKCKEVIRNTDSEEKKILMKEFLKAAKHLKNNSITTIDHKE